MRDRMGWTAVFALGAICWLGACDNEGLDGPESFEFDDIRHLTLDVEQGEVMIFATQRAEGGARVDRWSTPESDFQVRQESNSAGGLVIETVCNGGADCRVRYEVVVSPRTDIDVRVGRGDLQIVRAEGPLKASVDRGDLTARNIYSRVAKYSVGNGKLNIQYPEMPGRIDLAVSDDSSALVEIPAGPYRCYFDQRALEIEMGELICESGVTPAIVIDPRDASVRFEVEDKQR